MPARPDPFVTLGVSRNATDAEIRSAYRRLVQLHHPDHNGGSTESARRFEEVQEAYAEVRKQRQSGARSKPGSGASGSTRRQRPRTASTSPPASSDDPNLGSRLAAMEAELRAARDEAVRKARAAAARAQGQSERASDEELGYISTDDSFSKILHDAASGLSDRFDEVQKEARDSPVTKRFADLIDELGSKLTGEPPDRK